MSNPNLDTSARPSPATPAADPEMPPLLGLLAAGESMSGPLLARRLGISRAAVWKQVEVLRSAGLEIVSGTHGYQLARPLAPLEPARIRAGLPASAQRMLGGLENHWRLDSTSNEIARRVAELSDLSFVFADWQDAGRGRRGRQWLSPPGANLQFSCLKRFAGGYAALSGLSLVAGIATARALEDCGVRGIGLKWPNDLVHGDAKLGGILIELGGEFMGPCHAIVGIGVNVYLSDAMRAALDRSCADITELCAGKTPSRNMLAAALVTRLIDALHAFDRSGFAAFADAWTERDVLNGRRIRVQGGRGPFDGIAAGVDARGALKVRVADELRSIDSAEVTVRPA